MKNRRSSTRFGHLVACKVLDFGLGVGVLGFRIRFCPVDKISFWPLHSRSLTGVPALCCPNAVGRRVEEEIPEML